MRVIWAAIFATVVLGIAAAAILTTQQRTAYESFATTGARVGEPGSNLVGPRWNGLGSEQTDEHRG